MSTYQLPFIPGTFAETDNLDYFTASLNGTHPSNNATEYDTHSLYGLAGGKATYESIRDNQNNKFADKLPFVVS